MDGAPSRTPLEHPGDGPLALRPSHPKGAPPLVRSRSHASSESALPHSRCRIFHIDLIIVPRSGSATHPEPRPLATGRIPLNSTASSATRHSGHLWTRTSVRRHSRSRGSDARRSDSLFAAVVSSILGPRGRAAVVLPRSLLQRKGPEAQLAPSGSSAALSKGSSAYPKAFGPGQSVAPVLL